MTSFYVARSSRPAELFSFGLLDVLHEYVSANRFGPGLELRTATLAVLRLALEVTFPAVYDASPS